MGPGTHLITRLLRGDYPTSYNDALALRHDIEYLADGEKTNSDWAAVVNADYSIQGLAMKLGLSTRILVDKFLHIFGTQFHPNGRTDKLNHIATPLLQQRLLRLAEPMLNRYGISARLQEN